MSELLKTDKLTMHFGGLVALESVNTVIREREIVALIGPNGAGKTTFFNCITGIYTPSGGRVMATRPGRQTKTVNGYKPNKITELGLARTFQNIRLFQNLTVLENVMIGRHCRMHAGILGAALRGPKTREEEHTNFRHCYEMLRRFDMGQHVNILAKNLPYGIQRRLEIVRAMATDPFLLLLDEPAAGMNATETRSLIQLIRKIREEDQISILLIEHDMSLVMTLSDRIYVMDYGRLIAQGTPEEIRHNPVVIKAYLGEEA